MLCSRLALEESGCVDRSGFEMIVARNEIYAHVINYKSLYGVIKKTIFLEQKMQLKVHLHEKSVL